MIASKVDLKRAIERGNLVIAETTARELGRLSLDEALALTALVARHEPAGRSRFAVRWLERLLEEDDRLSIEEGGAGGIGARGAWRPGAPRGASDAFGHGGEGD